MSSLRVLVTGAAGSGTSTLGEALARRWQLRFLEADAYYWLETDPPFTQKRLPEERNAVFRQVLEAESGAVVAGSVMAWGEAIENAFDLIVFLYVPTEIRLQRLEAREVQRYGKANPEFLEWAAQYDEGAKEGRSLTRHQAWLAARKCAVLRLSGDSTVGDWVALVEKELVGNGVSSETVASISWRIGEQP